jgi:sterol desaturase/sphingolipid hydroxylase (fatty acid hydroxylase superfamily)
VLHHKRDKMAEANFNITLPIFDFFLGTLFWQAMGEFEKEQTIDE